MPKLVPMTTKKTLDGGHTLMAQAQAHHKGLSPREDAMTINEIINRGYNFFVVAFLGILAGSLISELSQESEWLFRIDELALIAIGVIAVVWYLVGRNRLTRSWIPLLLAVLAFAAKVIGLMTELHDAQDVGDDIGMVQLLLLLVIVSAIAYALARRQTQKPKA
jgi:hypothetical protein